jgi:hypothetical protein
VPEINADETVLTISAVAKRERAIDHEPWGHDVTSHGTFEPSDQFPPRKQAGLKAPTGKLIYLRESRRHFAYGLILQRYGTEARVAPDALLLRFFGWRAQRSARFQPRIMSGSVRLIRDNLAASNDFGVARASQINDGKPHQQG